MSSPYLKLKVVDITQETADAITLHFEHPEKQAIPYKFCQCAFNKTLFIQVNWRG